MATWFESNDPYGQPPPGATAYTTMPVGTPQRLPATAVPGPVANTGGGVPQVSPLAMDERWFRQTFGTPGTPQQLEALESRLNQYGIRIQRSADGTAGKIKLPDGTSVDIIKASHAGGQGFQWLATRPGEPGSRGYLPPGYSMGTFTGGGMYPLASVMGPGLAQPWTTPFKRRSPEEIAKDPSFQFQLKEGLGAIQRSAAAKGTLLTGGTLKALDSFGQGLAHTFDDTYYNRDLGEYQMAYGIYGDNQRNQFNRLSGLAGLGQQMAGNAAQTGSAYGQNAGNTMTDIGAALGGGQIGAGNAWGGALGNLGNIGSNLWYLNYLRNQQPQGLPPGVLI